MASLNQRGLRRAFGPAERLPAPTTLDGHAPHGLGRLPDLGDCDICSYNGINPGTRRMNWMVAPENSGCPDSAAIFATHMRQHPQVAYWNQESSAAHRFLVRGSTDLNPFRERRL